MHPLLAQVPDDLLHVERGDSNHRMKRAITLMRWFERRGYRPTFVQLEAERQRRKDNP